MTGKHDMLWENITGSEYEFQNKNNQGGGGRRRRRTTHSREQTQEKTNPSTLNGSYAEVVAANTL